MTASFDSTVRIWDIEKPRTNKYVISIKSKLPGGRSPITAISYSPDGKLIVAAAQDGSITVWPATGPFIKPIRV